MQPNNLTMDKELLNAAKTTQTLDFNELDNTTENIYESLVMISRRAEQINEEMLNLIKGPATTAKSKEQERQKKV